VAENPDQHGSSCGHVIPGDSVAGELKRQLEIAVAKRSKVLHFFRIGSDADQERCQAVTKIAETESVGDHRRWPRQPLWRWKSNHLQHAERFSSRFLTDVERCDYNVITHSER
jgi:hypothetical protein